MSIVAYCKDPGGYNGMMPVVAELRRRGRTVLLIAEGKAIEYLRDAGEAFVTFENANEALPFVIKHADALITSMCSGDSIGRDLVRLLKEANSSILTVAIQDTWGGATKTSWKDQIYRPWLIMVNDQIGKSVVLEDWPDYSPERIRVTGFPALDRLASVNIASLRASGREKLCLTSDEKLVMFAGQLPFTGQALQELVIGLNPLSDKSRRVVLYARAHPRMDEAEKGESEIWHKALESYNGMRVSSAVTADEATAACDLLVTINAQMAVDAAIMGKPVITIRYHVPKERRDRFPLVELGCAYDPQNRATLVLALSDFMSKGQIYDLRRTQKEVFRLDGRNAARIVDEIEGL